MVCDIVNWLKDVKERNNLEVTVLQGIGEILKKTREAKGITLDEVAEVTKIRSKYLEAIEKEDFQTLPGEVYVRGFVTAYLKYLGIKDQPEVTEIMKTKIVQPQEPAPAHIEDEKEKEKERQTRAKKRNKAAHASNSRKKMPAASFEEKPLSKKSSMIIILSIVAIVILLALQWVYTKSQQDEIPPANMQQQQNNENQPTDENNSEVDHPDANGVEPPVEPQEPINTVYEGLEMHLEVVDLNPATTEQCWMQLIVDGQTTEMTMSEGQTQDIKAAESIKVKFGNAGVVNVTLNGQDLGALGSQGQVVKKEFKVEDYVTSGQ